MTIARARGFTLLEVLLALVLMALAMVGVWGALRTGARLAGSADALIAQSDRTRAVQQFLRACLGGAQPQTFAPGVGQPARMFTGEDRAMHYVAPMPAQLGDGGLFVQTLQLVRDERHDDYMLQLTYAPLSGDTASATTSQPQTLLLHVADGHFRYLAAASGGNRARWLSAWKDTNGMPLAVRIDLQPGWRDRVGFPSLLIPLRAGNGYAMPLPPGTMQ